VRSVPLQHVPVPDHADLVARRRGRSRHAARARPMQPRTRHECAADCGACRTAAKRAARALHPLPRGDGVGQALRPPSTSRDRQSTRVGA
jgi:hypothetical protein